jgi:hypothetical protein
MTNDCCLGFSHVRINTYADVRPNKTICKLYAAAMATLNSKVKCDETSEPFPGSTDQGNVSYVCPSIHAYVGIITTPGASNHTPGFTAHAGTRDAHERCVVVAKGMAMAGWKVLVDDDAAAQVWKDFEEDKARRHLPAGSFASGPVGGCC